MTLPTSRGLEVLPYGFHLKISGCSCPQGPLYGIVHVKTVHMMILGQTFSRQVGLATQGDLVIWGALFELRVSVFGVKTLCLTFGGCT